MYRINKLKGESRKKASDSFLSMFHVNRANEARNTSPRCHGATNEVSVFSNAKTNVSSVEPARCSPVGLVSLGSTRIPLADNWGWDSQQIFVARINEANWHRHRFEFKFSNYSIFRT